MAGLKSERQIREALSRRLSRSYAEDVAGDHTSWPYAIPLGRPSKQEILKGFADLDALVRTLRAWESTGDVEVIYEQREAGGPKRLPLRVVIPSRAVAAELAAPRDNERWTTIIERTQRRFEELSARFPHLDVPVYAQVLRKMDGADDLQFELLLSAGSWFLTHDARGLSPREVPLPGIDGKWLNTARNRSLVCLLAGKEELGLVGRPQLVEFAYLDPGWLAQGGRHYDSAVVGDVSQPQYVPDWALIVENKDTYLNFPAMKGGICIFGSGNAGMTAVRRVPWMQRMRRLFYWGDLDADGFEILAGYRAQGISCTSILMDRATVTRFGRYGTRLEKDHRTPLVRERKELAMLDDEERATYELLTSASYRGNVRLEQEKIPLAEAVQALEQALKG